MRQDLKFLTQEQKVYLIKKICKEIQLQTNKVGCFWAEEEYTLTALKRAFELKNKKDYKDEFNQ